VQDELASRDASREPSPGVNGNSQTLPSPSKLDLQTLDKITALRGAFPTATVQDIEHGLRRYHGDERRAYARLNRSHQSAMDLEDVLVFQKSLENMPLPRETSSKSAHRGTEKREAGDEEEDGIAARPRPTYQGASHDLRPGAATRLSRSLSLSGTGRRPSNHDLPLANDEDDETSSDESTSEWSSDSDSDTDSDMEPESKVSSAVSAGDEDDESPTSTDDETSSSSDEDSDSEPELASANPRTFSRETRGQSRSRTSPSPISPSDAEDDTSDEDTSSDSDTDTSSDESSSDDDEPSFEPDSGARGSSQQAELFMKDPRSRPGVRDINETTVPPNEPKNQHVMAGEEEAHRGGLPGHGISRTRNRNARRRAARKAREQATIGASSSHDEVRGTADSNEPSLEQRRQALLSVVAASQNQETSPADMHHRASEGAEQDESARSITSSPSQPRARIDLGAGRRLLFGALGLRNPKTKADEDKLRANLMKDVRPLVNHRMASDPILRREDSDRGNDRHAPAVLDDDPEAWRDKITYSAVECCHEGVNLSEPPFPFVQRWDPQQQGAVREGKSRRGGRGKRKERNQSDFYEGGDSHGPFKKRRLENSVDNRQNAHPWFDDQAGEHDTPVLNYDDEDVAANSPVGESQLTDVDDLPSLPEDLSGLPALRVGEAKAGMVITWKQWLLSTATNWQPQLSNLTAVVVNADDDGTALRVLLSRRDRNLDHAEKQYDSITGQRVYDRFEAPELDAAEVQDTSAEEDLEEGFRDLQFSDLIEPRIVQSPVGVPLSTEGDGASGIVSDAQKQTGLCTNPQEASTATANGDAAVDGDHATKSDSHAQGSITGRSHDAEDAVVPDAAAHSNSMGCSQAAPTAQITGGAAGSGTDDAASQAGPKDLFVTDLSELSSPSRQLELEDMLDAAVYSSHQGSRERSCQATPNHRGPTANLEVECSPAGCQTQEVKYPSLAMPTSAASSIHSGRQPDPDCGVDLDEVSQDLVCDRDDSRAQLAAPRPVKDESTTAKPGSPGPSAAGSSSSLPSISDLWLAVTASRSTQSSAKPAAASATKSWKAAPPEDLEKQELTRRLNEGVDKSGDKKAVDGERLDIKDTDTQSLLKLDDIATFRKPVSPPALNGTRKRAARPSSQFSILDRSQAISTVSSSLEPKDVETHAENGIDEADSVLRSLKKASQRASQSQQDSAGMEDDSQVSAKGAVSTSSGSVKPISPSLPAPSRETRRRRTRKSAISG